MNTEVARKIEQIFLKQKDNFKYDWAAEAETRVRQELLGYGPIDLLLQDSEITEVIANNYKSVFYEKGGVLFESSDHFYSEQTYYAALERLSQNCGTYLCREKPFVEAQIGHLRITIIFAEISRGHPILSIRVQPKTQWTLQALFEKKFLTDAQFSLVKRILSEKGNFIVIGSTGSGKTSFLQGLLSELSTERIVIIEDTQELHPPNATSVSLLTRQDPSQTVTDVSMDDLIKRALRLRPDRLIVGEIRGKEAMSLLMALATGHDGSFGSLHARSAHEALLRLEMLIQMGAPQWSLVSIRRLIAMTVQYVFVLEKSGGIRKLKEIFEICSLEETGLTVSRIDG